MIPAAILFGFYIGQHKNYDDDKLAKGLGLRGIWTGISIGLTFQIISQLIIIHCYADWTKIAYETK